MFVTAVCLRAEDAMLTAMEQAGRAGFRAVYRDKDSGLHIVVDEPQPPPQGEFDAAGYVVEGRWEWV